jgi:hypothetical protein
MQSTYDIFSALTDGERIRHISFKPFEYIFINGAILEDQDGTDITGLDYLNNPHEWETFELQEFSWADLCIEAEGKYESMDEPHYVIEFRPNDGGLYCLSHPDVSLAILSTKSYYKVS